jgi:catechol 2,3-dioxygenase-like lactoylglutathione lyase family enzyme
MKRFHVHVSVPDLGQSIRFYSAMFGMQPTVEKGDYAKWMLDDPRVNFAISQRRAAVGLNHLGFQVDSAEELTALREQVAGAEIAALDEPNAACCYAKSDKYWITDPQGIAWETFHTLGEIPVFGKGEATASAGSACCAPEVKVEIAPTKSSGCAPQSQSKTSSGSCCG